METLWFAIAATPVIVALVQLAKQTGFPSKFSGLLAVALGIAGGVGFQLADPQAHTIVEAGFQGLLAGLSAGGLWSGVQATREGIKAHGEH